MIGTALAYALLALGLLGHLALWVVLFNRIHALGIPRRLIKLSELLHVLAVVAIPLVWAWRLTASGPMANPVSAIFSGRFLDAVYVAVASSTLVYIAIRWSLQHLFARRSASFVASSTARHDVARELGQPLTAGVAAKVLSLVPCNEVTTLTVTEKEFELARLEPTLDGLSILHLSDLHFTGKIARPFYDFVIERANETDPDLVVVTGDIIDKESCLDWIAPTLGRLRARHGKYFILGNHDKRLRDVTALRERIGECGFVDLGGVCQVFTVRGRQVLLAGNELPWFGPAPAVPPRGKTPEHETAAADAMLRILLSHSPDQLPWARANDFDLMLAGHTHGGQIRLPVIGPLVSPSRYGVRYASGTFDEPPTLLHVSRGVSGVEPIRINCPPEVTRVVLRSKTPAPSAAGSSSAKTALLAQAAG